MCRVPTTMCSSIKSLSSIVLSALVCSHLVVHDCVCYTNCSVSSIDEKTYPHGHMADYIQTVMGKDSPSHSSVSISPNGMSDTGGARSSFIRVTL